MSYGELTLTMKAFAWDPLSWLVVGANRPFDIWKRLTFPLNLQKAVSVARGEEQFVYLRFGFDFRICAFPSFCLFRYTTYRLEVWIICLKEVAVICCAVNVDSGSIMGPF